MTMVHSIRCVRYAAFMFGFLLLVMLTITVATHFSFYIMERLDDAGFQQITIDANSLPDLTFVYSQVHIGLLRACVRPYMQGMYYTYMA